MAELELVPLSLLFLPLVIIVPLLYFIRPSRRYEAGIRPPPSPWALPVIGHLHHVARALPHRAMRDLSRRYGPLMLLRLCEIRVVVACSADAAREIMKTQDLAFASRPMNPMGKFLLGDSPGLVMAPYGKAWRQLRRICTLELFTSRRVRSFRPVREEEVGRLLRSLSSQSASQVNLSELIGAYVADSAVRAVIGSRFKGRDEFLRMLDRRMKITPTQSLPDLFPSSRLALLISRMPRQMKRERREMMELIGTIIQEHQENSMAAAVDDDEDFLHVLLRIQREGKLDPPLTDEDIKTVIVDIFMASSETSSTVMHWAMAELMRNLRVMRRAQDELRRVLDGKNQVVEESLGGLRYLDLVIKEALRLHPPGPLLLPRECRRPCQVLGFDVPAGAMVLVNAWAIGRDPAYWERPEEFLPERFVGGTVDFKGMDFEFIPFGAGRRMCPGMAFGLANMELVLASLLYHFDWELPHGMEPGELDMTELFGISTRRRSDLLLVPTVRVPLLAKI